MYGNWVKTARALGLGAVIAVAGGCSAAEVIPYPKLSSVKRIKDKLLSKDEQNAAIRDLALEQKQHRAEAEREIEKR